MKRKTFIISIIAILASLFSISYTFAANNKMDNVANGVRNVVGGAENVVENAGSAIGNTVKDATGAIGNGAKNVGRATENTVGAVTNNGNNDRYTASRTSTAGTDNAVMGGMSTSTYTWVIVGITIVAIGILLWSYFRQNANNSVYINSDDE